MLVWDYNYNFPKVVILSIEGCNFAGEPEKNALFPIFRVKNAKVTGETSRICVK